jgi:hypothetical protein
MLNIHIPLRSLRSAVQRYAQFYKAGTDEPLAGSKTENQDSSPLDQPCFQENQPKAQPSESGFDRIFIFLCGVARAAAIGLFVALILAAIPWFEPDIQPFQTRLVQFVQQFAIPICSGLLIWYGVRAALR